MERYNATKIRLLALVALMTAVTIVFTLIVRVPIPLTKGYITLADVAVYFSAFAFGPLVGGLTAGLGTGLADLIGGYPHWMVLSFIIHGLQAVVAALVARKKTLPSMIAGAFAGAFIMVAGYFTASAFLYGVGPALSDLPWNCIQVAVGALVGTPLMLAVKKAYPPLTELTSERSWEEE
ncbi:MAG: ECF transporter S component [Spirochaetales bacterium]|nr:ECF transporter S component [Spirochaetales bacterium]